MLASGDSVAFCDHMTVGFLMDNNYRPDPEGLKYCRFAARRDDAKEPDYEVQAEVVRRGKRSATVELTFGGFPPLYAGLVSDGRQWLIDDYRDSIEPDRLGRQPRPPAVTSGVSAEELETFLDGARPDNYEVSCEQVTRQDLGEWECKTTVSPPDGPPKEGVSIATIGLDGDVSSENSGAGGADGCCMELPKN